MIHGLALEAHLAGEAVIAFGCSHAVVCGNKLKGGEQTAVEGRKELDRGTEYIRRLDFISRHGRQGVINIELERFVRSPAEWGDEAATCVGVSAVLVAAAIIASLVPMQCRSK